MATESQIAQAAIKADLEHQGWEHLGGGEFHKQTTGGAMSHVRTDYYVRDGSVRIERSPNYSDSDFAEAEASLKASMQENVFEYWPRAIEDVFSKWEYGKIPTGMPFSIAASFTNTAANELSAGVSVDDDGSDYSPGNARLASDLSNLEERTKQLSGSYASTFSDSYVTPLGPVLERQRSMAAVLSIAAAAEEEIWTRANTDLYTIKTQALAAMEASAPDSGGGTDWGAVLTVLGAVAAGVAAFATAGSSLAVAAALTSAGAGAAGGLIESPPEESEREVPLGASDPHKVLENIDKALHDPVESLSAFIRTQEEKIQEILSSVTSAATGGTAGMFDLPPPKIATAPAGEVLNQEQSVIVTPEIIGRITSLWIPTIVGDLRLARKFLVWDSEEAWQRSDGIGLGSTGPMKEYHALTDAAVSIIGNTAQELEDSGQSLLDAAKVIGLADEGVNQGFREQAREITDLNQNHV